VCAIGTGLVELARGYGPAAIIGVALVFAFVYGALRVVVALYGAGILRGR
jgi:hypothetical protein